MAGIKKFLQDSGWITDDENTDKKSPVPSKSGNQPNKSQTSSKVNPVSHINKVEIAEVNTSKIEQATKYFFDLLDTSDLPGPDFREFYKALIKSKKMLGTSVTDEKLLYVATLSNIDGLTLDIITSSKDHYIHLMEEKYNSFIVSDSQKRETNSDAMRQNIENIQSSINDKQEQIKKLNFEITELQNQLKSINNELEQENKNLDAVKTAFTSAYSAITSEMNQVAQKCQMYFQGI